MAAPMTYDPAANEASINVARAQTAAVLQVSHGLLSRVKCHMINQEMETDLSFLELYYVYGSRQKSLGQKFAFTALSVARVCEV